MPEIEINFDLHRKQMALLQSPATEILFGGSMEGGKSHALRVCNIIWCLDIPYLQSVLIRKKYDDILANHVEGPTGFKALLRDLTITNQVKITDHGIAFRDTHANIDFMHCQDERQFSSAQGVERHVVNIDEATQIVEKLIRMFRGWARMPKAMKELLPPKYKGRFPRINYTANPIGPSVPFFRKQFVKPRPAGAIERVEGFDRQYIPSSVFDNPSADIEAHEGRKLGFGDPAMIAALGGNWDAPFGDFFPEWDEQRHVIPNFIPPTHWHRYRSFDWGTAEPFAVYWFAVSDGEMFEAEVSDFKDGLFTTEKRRLWYPRGALVVYREWYGANEDRPAEGLRMRNSEIARGILVRSPGKEEANLTTLTDSAVFPDRGFDEGQTIAKTFFENGVPLTLGDTARKTGWAAMRDRLIGRQLDSNSPVIHPMIYFQDSCKYARDYIPTLPRHPLETRKEDAAEHGETTHSCDAIRLGCMATPMVKDKPPEQYRPNTSNLTNMMTFNQALKKVQQLKARVNGGGW